MDKITLRHVGAVCAVSYAIGLARLLVLLGTTPGMMEAEGATELLPILAEQSTHATMAAWLLILLPVLLAVAGLSFFHALREVGSLMWVAMAAFVGGAFLLIYRPFVWLAVIHELAPAYVAASEGTKEALAVVGDTLNRFAYMGDLVGPVLVVGIGVLLFSLTIPRTSLAPRWVAWIGVFAAIVGGWLPLLVPVASVLEPISLLGIVAWWVWMVAMGVTVWRNPEHTGA